MITFKALTLLLVCMICVSSVSGGPCGSVCPTSAEGQITEHTGDRVIVKVAVPRTDTEYYIAVAMSLVVGFCIIGVTVVDGALIGTAIAAVAGVGGVASDVAIAISSVALGAVGVTCAEFLVSATIKNVPQYNASSVDPVTDPVTGAMGGIISFENTAVDATVEEEPVAEP